MDNFKLSEISFDRDKSLEELENSYWGWEGEGKYYSYLVEECHKFRRIPLKNLGSYELSTLIGQDICSEYLIPLALEYLLSDPLNDSDEYEGCLLSTLMRYDPDYWEKNPNLTKYVYEVCHRVQLIIENDKTIIDLYFKKKLNVAYLFFTEFGPYINKKLLSEKKIFDDKWNCLHVCEREKLAVLSIVACRGPISMNDISSFIYHQFKIKVVLNYLVSDKYIICDDGLFSLYPEF